MDSYLSFTNLVAAAICFLALLGTIFFYRKSISHQENKTMDSSSLTRLAHPSSLPHSWIHHVFPSFHGEDVRKNFLSHILREFRSKGINLFIDNEIERSRSIGPELIEAIKGSRIAIVLLSKNYASSTWCLNELVEIMNCREEFGQTLISLFYHVDPTHVKKQTGDFGKVFRKACKGKTEEEIRRWKRALTEVAQIAGYHSTNWDTEAEMIEAIATDVSNKLNNSAPTSDFEVLVGMESQMTKMRGLLRLDSDEVRKIGIWGPPGIGKTTIARSLFNIHSQDFQLSVFIDNIKRKQAVTACSDDYSVKLELQKQFMSQLTNEAAMKIPHLGIAKDRLKDKKVLVVLDDVDHSIQLEAMAKETSWFGPGSRIIVTTQDERVLKASGINHIHKVKLPSKGEAFQMFCRYAFDQKYPKHGFRKFAWEVVKLVGQLPLGLRVMGSYFRGMSEQDWTEALPRLKTHLDRDGEIASILKFSYDALHDEDKILFLHIACFFHSEHGERVEIVEGCLEKCFSDVRQGLRVLAEKSLISVGYSLEMPKLLVQLGRKIVQEQSFSDPGKRQVLIDAVDIDEVHSDDKADSSSVSSSVIGIDLNEDIVCTSERAFERLSNLQFLRIHGRGVNPLSMIYVSRKLRVLIWRNFKMPCFPSSFNPKFLVKLEMPFSHLKKLWEGIQPLSNLKWIDLSGSIDLEELPDLSTATNLYSLNLIYCSSLMQIPSSIGNAVKLDELYLSHCSSLVEIPSSIMTIGNLKSLSLDGCSSLVEIPFNIETIINHMDIDLSHCSSLVRFPFSFGNTINLKKLNLSYCSSLVELPFSIGNVIDFNELNLSHCSSLVELPFSFGNAVNLKELNLSHCTSLVKLPSSIENAVNLQYFNLKGCSSLVELYINVGNALRHNEFNLGHCSSLVEFPSSSKIIASLRSLDLNGCSSLVKLTFNTETVIVPLYIDLSGCSILVELNFSFGNAVNIKRLDLSHCSSLVKLPLCIGNAYNLEGLYLSHCSSLVELPSSMIKLGRLSTLYLDKCSKLEVVLANINLESLNIRNLSSCSLLKSSHDSSIVIQELDPWIERISHLRHLLLWGMKKLVSLPSLPDSISNLDASNCESLERLDCSFRNPDIRLNFANCFKLNEEARDLIIQTRTNRYAVFPAEEVPLCFPYRSYGSSVTVKLNQKPLGKSTRFKACIICASDEENDFRNWREDYVCCSITSGGNALTACYTRLERVFTGHLYTFEVEVKTEEVTSTELVFDYVLDSSLSNTYPELKIKECGMLQLLELDSSLDSDTEI